MTLSISAADGRRRKMAKNGFVYLFLALFCALFGAVYEAFSHEVYSYYMLYAFAVPLAGGVLPFFGLAFTRLPLPGRICLNLYHSGIASLTAGSILKGVLEIYGTTNSLIAVYWIAGTALLFSGIIFYLMRSGRVQPEPSSTKKEEAQ